MGPNGSGLEHCSGREWLKPARCKALAGQSYPTGGNRSKINRGATARLESATNVQKTRRPGWTPDDQHAQPAGGDMKKLQPILRICIRPGGLEGQICFTAITVLPGLTRFCLTIDLARVSLYWPDEQSIRSLRIYQNAGGSDLCVPSTLRSLISKRACGRSCRVQGTWYTNPPDGDYVRAVCRELCALGVGNVVVEAGPSERDSCYV